MYHTELTIHEKFAFSKTTPSCSLGFQKLESLFACLSSIRAWFDIWFQFPVPIYTHFNFLVFAQLIRCVVTLKRLSTVEEPDWDSGLVDSTANLSSIIDRLVSNLQENG